MSVVEPPNQTEKIEPSKSGIAETAFIVPPIHKPSASDNGSQNAVAAGNFAKYMRVVGIILGNLVEWYDWAIFGLVANEIGQNFFADKSETGSSLKAFAIFSSAFMMRPVGAFVFGYIGDVYGRVISLRYSILLMGFSTVILGLLPTYDQIGVYATVILMLVRLCQGLSVGGEGITSTVYLYEEAPADNRIWYMFVCSLAACGSLVANLMMFTLHATLTAEQMVAFGWRIPFIFSSLLLGLCMVLRQNLEETHQFQETDQNDQTENPITHVFQFEWKQILAIILLKFDTFYYVLFTWIPEYYISLHSPKIEQANLSCLLVRIIVMMLTAFMGWYGDRCNQFASMYVCTIIKMIVAIPIFYLTLPYVTNWWELTILMVPLTVIDGMIWVVKHVWVFNLLPNVKTRTTSLGIAHNVTAVLSGLNPSLCAFFIHQGFPVSIIGTLDFGYSFVVLCALTFIFFKKDSIMPRRPSGRGSESENTEKLSN